MLTTRYKPVFARFFAWPARQLARRHVSPTVITLSSVAFTTASCVFLLATGRVFAFCVLATLSGMLDALDGAVARASGRVTKFGAYLDAVCDRYVDVLVVGTVAIVTGYWALSFLVVAGALLVSYAKARAAMEIPVDNQEWPDLMERTERSIIFLGGLALSQFIPWKPMGRDLFWWALLVLAILVHGTVLQRIARARQLMALRSGQGPSRR